MSKLLKDKFGSATGSTYDTGKDIAKVLEFSQGLLLLYVVSLILVFFLP